MARATDQRKIDRLEIEYVYSRIHHSQCMLLHGSSLASLQTSLTQFKADIFFSSFSNRYFRARLVLVRSGVIGCFHFCLSVCSGAVSLRRRMPCRCHSLPKHRRGSCQSRPHGLAAWHPRSYSSSTDKVGIVLCWQLARRGSLGRKLARLVWWLNLALLLKEIGFRGKTCYSTPYSLMLVILYSLRFRRWHLE